MPIPVAPVNRQARSALGELPIEGGNQGPVLSVDRSLAIEVIVVFGNLQQALPRHVPAARYVFEEWDNVFTPLRPAEGDQQQRVVSRAIAHLLFTGRGATSAAI